MELLVLTAMLATASGTSAQSIVDAGRLEFTPSSDHDAVDSTTGAAIVQSYVLEIFLTGDVTAVRTVNLDKPSPQADGMIRLDFLSLVSPALATGLIYEAHIVAVGPGGSSASARSDTFAFGMSCPPTISPTSQWVPAAGVTGTSTVTATTGCGWTATSNAPWITISVGAAGSGSGSVTFSVAANAGSTSRTGTLTIGSETFTVTQDGAACAPSISAPSANAVAAGTTASVTVTANPGCAWTATSNAAWIAISAGASGTGNGSVTYAVARKR